MFTAIVEIEYCKHNYFRVAKFSRTKPYEANLRVLIFAHMAVN